MSVLSEELESLTLLIEECAEVSQAATKIMRFGWDSCAPDTPGYNNESKLCKEIGDFLAKMFVVIENCGLQTAAIRAGAVNKLADMREHPELFGNLEIPSVFDSRTI